MLVDKGFVKFTPEFGTLNCREDFVSKEMRKEKDSGNELLLVTKILR